MLLNHDKRSGTVRDDEGLSGTVRDECHHGSRSPENGNGTIMGR